jgi:hypothetical protein
MTITRGTIAIMGSGETTDSMVRVHRSLLAKLSPPVKAVFIDTPAGFQMNADDLFDKAREYFQKRLNQPLDRVSFISSKGISTYEAEKLINELPPHPVSVIPRAASNMIAQQKRLMRSRMTLLLSCASHDALAGQPKR